MGSTDTVARTVTIGVGTPEQGWQPALDWLTAHGLTPTEVIDVSVNTTTLAASANVYVMEAGEHCVENDDPVTKTIQFQAKTLPPRWIDHLAQLPETRNRDRS